ncbi:hypothetical protein [Nonomuraea sp. B19D2]|uniref:hypothetical protein n=1 Tax=Nonomuraea sp. B19D2 TaxID=3159561 RepID=UPI0032DBE669
MTEDAEGDLEDDEQEHQPGRLRRSGDLRPERGDEQEQCEGGDDEHPVHAVDDDPQELGERRLPAHDERLVDHAALPDPLAEPASNQTTIDANLATIRNYLQSQGQPQKQEETDAWSR